MVNVMTGSVSNEVKSLDAVVIGAGFSGLYALYRLRDVLGLNVRVYETGGGVGGTWFWNRYPGARCDSESYYYSFSFSEELDQDWVWSSKYPEHQEIRNYLNHVADRFDLRKDIKLDTRVADAVFNEETGLWDICTEQGEQVSARFLISAVGCLSAANMPDVPGLDTFEGDFYHTGKWPQEGVDFSDKRVGLIGTGSTGIQATPIIAAEADELTIFQRTPNFTVPARNAPVTAEDAAEIKANYPEIRQATKESRAGFPFTSNDRSCFDVSEEERLEIYEELWQEGGFKFMWGSFNDIMLDKKANATAADFIRSKIHQIVEDPDTAEMLCPKDYPYGAKRPPIDTDYFVTFNRDNVKLVDILKAPIIEIEKNGIRTEEGFFELDSIVFATGFDAMTGSLLKINIRGTDGLKLSDKWDSGPRTYLGLQVAGFPNMFTITGPGSPSVLVNMPVAIEQHVDWISDCIEHMDKEGVSRIEAKEEAENEWVEHVHDVAKMTLFYEAKSWYLGVNIPGKPRVFMPYVGGMPLYKQYCEESVRDGYKGFELNA
jgi:cation diffusion facilitator CzcD-associated flavoprotein CzcO